MLQRLVDTSITEGTVVQYANKNGMDCMFFGKVYGAGVVIGDTYSIDTRIELEVNKGGRMRWNVRKVKR